MNILNIAVWTMGKHARCNILPAINKSGCVNLVGVFTRDIDILISQSKQYGCYAYNSSDGLLQDLNVDAVYIGSPNAMHYEHVKQCLLNNKHVIVEKSALSSLEKTQEIIDLAKSKGLMIMEAFMFLYHRQFLNLKELIKSEKYGKMLFMEASFGFPHLDKDDIRYSEELDGGALNDAGAYTIRAILDLLDSNIKLIFSDLNTEDGYNVDTSGIAIFMKDGVRVVCKWVMGGSYKNEIRVWCETGHIVADRSFSKSSDYIASINVYSDGKEVERLVSGVDNHFIRMMDFFKKKIASNDYNFFHNELLMQSKLLDRVRNSEF